MLRRTSDTRTNVERTIVERTIDVVPRGHIRKTMSYLNSLTKKTYISISIMAICGFEILTSDQRSLGGL